MQHTNQTESQSNLVLPIAKAAKRRRGWRQRLLSSLSFLAGWLVLALGWELGAATGVLNRDILPPPSVVIPYLIQGPGSAGIGSQQVSYGEAIVRTLFRVATGLGLGLLAAVPLGTLIASVPLVRQFVMPLVQTIAPIAPVAWVPVAIALIGIGDQSAIFVVFMGIFAVMTLATAAAIASVPDELIKTAKSLGVKGAQLWLWVVLPAVAPSLLTIVRINFFAAWMAVLAGEMAGINSGLGALIILGQQQFNMKLVMVGIITIGVIGFVIDRLMLVLQQRLLWWDRVRTTGDTRG
ncbi:MAG: ABC transporter permease [Lyngbya sp. HA4199-MV5]|jgi:ABC-type nitrate/sulfonate/bicarbonate transport system permease component|nr:ABC transporter permease [Lyngbya sp. HA4199-MV5]